MKRIYLPSSIISVNLPQFYSPSAILSLSEDHVNVFAQVLHLSELPQLERSQYKYAILYILNLNSCLGQNSTIQKLSESDLDLAFRFSNFSPQTTLHQLNQYLFDTPSNILRPTNQIKFLYQSVWKKLDNLPAIPLDLQGLRDALHSKIDAIESQVAPLFTDRQLSPELMKKSSELIDVELCQGQINLLCQLAGKLLEFSVSKRMTSKGGTTRVNANSFEIKLSNSFSILKDDEYYLNSGVKCKGPLRCFLVTLMHELVHVLVKLVIYFKLKECSPLDGSSNLSLEANSSKFDLIDEQVNNVGNSLGMLDSKIYSSHGVLFKAIAYYYFGLTECTHSMFSNNQARPLESEAGQNLSSTSSLASVISGTSGRCGRSQTSDNSERIKSQLSIGERVFITLKEGRVYGNIIKLNPKRAIVRLTDTREFNVHYPLINK